MARTSAIAAGAMDRLVTPRPTNTRASSASAAASPHTPTGLPWRRPACAVRCTRSTDALGFGDAGQLAGGAEIGQELDGVPVGGPSRAGHPGGGAARGLTVERRS